MMDPATIRDVLKIFGIGRARARELFEWALANPREAAVGCDALAVFASHRVTVLRAKLKVRRWQGRLPVRIERMRSAATRLLPDLALILRAYADRKDHENQAMPAV